MLKRRLKLLFIIENEAYGGGEKVFSLLIRGLPAEKFEVFCASLPRGRFYEEVRGSRVLGALGRLEWQKGYPYLIEALALMLKSVPGPREKLICLLAGAGSLDTELKEQAEAVLKLAHDAPFAAGLGLNVRKKAALFGLPAYLSRHLEVYGEFSAHKGAV